MHSTFDISFEWSGGVRIYFWGPDINLCVCEM